MDAIIPSANDRKDIALHFTSLTCVSLADRILIYLIRGFLELLNKSGKLGLYVSGEQLRVELLSLSVGAKVNIWMPY
jgi:hypothetical protein